MDRYLPSSGHLSSSRTTISTSISCYSNNVFVIFALLLLLVLVAAEVVTSCETPLQLTPTTTTTSVSSSYTCNKRRNVNCNVSALRHPHGGLGFHADRNAAAFIPTAAAAAGTSIIRTSTTNTKTPLFQPASYNDSTTSKRLSFTSGSGNGNQDNAINTPSHQSPQRQRLQRQRLQPLQMSLIPIPVESLNKILTSKLPTPAQYASYWGRTSREQYNAFFEAFGVSFLGVFASYFLSFAIGQFVATIMGMVAGSWILLGPELKAYQRNWELTGGRELVDPWHGYGYDDEFEFDDDDPLFVGGTMFREDEDKRGLYGAFYFGRIEHICVVDYPLDPPEDEYDLEEFMDYTMEEDEQERETGIPYSLRLRVTDATDENGDGGRELQIHARMSEEYLDLEEGMPVCAVLLSTSQQFQTLAAITDFCVPDGGPTWVGDYPYLDRAALEEMFVEDRELWDYLRDEGRGRWDVNNWDDNE